MNTILDGHDLILNGRNLILDGHHLVLNGRNLILDRGYLLLNGDNLLNDFLFRRRQLLLDIDADRLVLYGGAAGFDLLAEGRFLWLGH